MSSEDLPPTHTSDDQRIIKMMRKKLERFDYNQKRRAAKRQIAEFWKLQHLDHRHLGQASQQQYWTDKSSQNLREQEEEAMRRVKAVEDKAIREADARRRAEEDTRRQAEEEEARRRMEEEAGRRAEGEARRQAEEGKARQRAAEEDAKRQGQEEEARQRAEAEEARRQREREREHERRCRQEEDGADSKRRRKKPAANREQQSSYRTGNYRDTRDSQVHEITVSHADQIASYERRWEKLVNISKGGPSMLKFSQLPWPLFDPKPKDISDWTPDLIQQFILHPQRLQAVSSRMILRTELRRWHPDRFWNIVSPIPDERKKVAEASLLVADMLTILNSQCADNLK